MCLFSHYQYQIFFSICFVDFLHFWFSSFLTCSLVDTIFCEFCSFYWFYHWFAGWYCLVNFEVASFIIVFASRHIFNKFWLFVQFSKFKFEKFEKFCIVCRISSLQNEWIFAHARFFVFCFGFKFFKKLSRWSHSLIISLLLFLNLISVWSLVLHFFCSWKYPQAYFVEQFNVISRRSRCVKFEISQKKIICLWSTARRGHGEAAAH